MRKTNHRPFKRQRPRVKGFIHMFGLNAEENYD